MDERSTFKASVERSKLIEEKIKKDPSGFRVLTGERPTGPLHIGHFFGSLQNRLILQKKNVELWLVVADYQVLTDRSGSADIKTNVLEVIADYLSIGLNPREAAGTTIFAHSYVSSLNQLLLPFLSLVSTSELQRNPTVKSEIQMSGMESVNSLMYTYPVHQAADILFCHGNLVPGGKDQLPHVELTRLIARRFNERYSPDKPYFREPEVLLSETPLLLGLDGRKMGKSLNNSIYLKSTEDETAELIKKAKTDADRNITYDPESRPEVSNLLKISSLCTKQSPEEIAASIGDGGGGKLKKVVTEAINEFFKDTRAERKRLIADKKHLTDILREGNAKAEDIGRQTLKSVQEMLGMNVL